MYGDWNIDFQAFVSTLGHVAIAYLLALPIGWNREKSEGNAGLRTIPLVSMGSCAYMLIGLQGLHDDSAHSQVMYGIIVGIGFIGGGAILKSTESVRGTATAATIWNMGALGIAVAWRLVELAIILSLLNFLILYVLGRLKRKIVSDNSVEE